MGPNWYPIIFLAILFFSLLLSYFYRTTSEKNKKKWYWHYPERFCFYSGLTYLYRKFIPKEKDTPATGWIWLLGSVYIAVYAFTSQRYENKLDHINFIYNTFITQVASDGKFSNKRLLAILNTETPVKPKIFEPYSVFKSLYTKSNPDSKKGYSEKFFQSYNYASAGDFRQEIIDQWNTKLDGADFFEAKFDGADFRSAKLGGANFRSANLDRANFNSAILEGANFFNAKLKGANFTDAKLKDANFEHAKFKDAKFENAQLKGADFTDTELEKADFWYAELKGANFESAELKEVNFRNANLEGVNFRNAELDAVDFRSAKLDGANFTYTKFKGVYFSEAEPEGLNFSAIKLKGVYFSRAYLEGFNFSGANLEGVDFRNTKLDEADFKDAKCLTAKQLILASSIYRIKNCPPKVIEDIKKLGCEEMLEKRPGDWSWEFRKHRKKLLIKWNKEKMEKAKNPTS